LTKTKKMYTAFGLHIESELELPELITSNGQADGTIVLGEVPEQLEESVKKTPWYEITAGKFLLTVDGIAKYYVENGEQIFIKPDLDAKMDDIRVFLLNSIFPVFLQQRGFLVLHGSAAVIDGKGTAFIGGTAVGKTAIAFNLYNRGHQIVTDEVCAVGMKNGKAVILPGIPQLNVWHDTLQAVGKDTGSCRSIRQGLMKYAFSTIDRYDNESVELSNIVLLKNHNRDDVIIEAIKGGKKLENLIRNIHFIETVANQSEHFKICAAAAAAANMIQITFDNRTHSFEEVTDSILEEIR